MGSDILLDHVREDWAVLDSMPKGAHLGQLEVSWLKELLPEPFLMQYQYEFLYWMECTLLKMRERARIGADLTAHSIMEELPLYLCCEEAESLMERNGEEDAPKEWVFDLFGDMDRIRFLYSHVNLEEDHFYHFSHWADRQFYRKRPL